MHSRRIRIVTQKDYAYLVMISMNLSNRRIVMVEGIISLSTKLKEVLCDWLSYDPVYNQWTCCTSNNTESYFLVLAWSSAEIRMKPTLAIYFVQRIRRASFYDRTVAILCFFTFIIGEYVFLIFSCHNSYHDTNYYKLCCVLYCIPLYLLQYLFTLVMQCIIHCMQYI